jgi:hypothetical protein
VEVPKCPTAGPIGATSVGTCRLTSHDARCGEETLN